MTEKPKIDPPTLLTELRAARVHVYLSDGRLRLLGEVPAGQRDQISANRYGLAELVAQEPGGGVVQRIRLPADCWDVRLFPEAPRDARLFPPYDHAVAYLTDGIKFGIGFDDGEIAWISERSPLEAFGDGADRWTYASVEEPEPEPDPKPEPEPEFGTTELPLVAVPTDHMDPGEQGRRR